MDLPPATKMHDVFHVRVVACFVRISKATVFRNLRNLKLLWMVNWSSKSNPFSIIVMSKVNGIVRDIIKTLIIITAPAQGKPSRDEQVVSASSKPEKGRGPLQSVQAGCFSTKALLTRESVIE